MNRKHNPLVSLVAVLILTVLLVLTLTGCDTAETENPPRFIYERAVFATNRIDMKAGILLDTETGVQYLVVDYGYGFGLTKLEPAPESEEGAP